MDIFKNVFKFIFIRSISRNAGVTPEQLKDFVKSNEIVLDDPKEWKLAKNILRFPEVLLKTLNDLLMHSICDYVYDLATTFTEFYDTCYCIEKDKQTGWVLNLYLAISFPLLNNLNLN